jgi:hypothetical protein
MRGTLSLDANSPLIRDRAPVRHPHDGRGERSAREREEAGADGMRQDRRSGGAGCMAPIGSIQGSVNSSTLQIPSGQGWKMNLSYSSTRQRPPVGDNVVSLDPTIVCEQFRLINPLSYGQLRAAAADVGLDREPVRVDDARRELLPYAAAGERAGEHVVPRGPRSGRRSGRRGYDVQRAEFASHVVSLQRELHDWDAIFAFSRSPNGNFSFNFFIALKAQPELKFNLRPPAVPARLHRQPVLLARA